MKTLRLIANFIDRLNEKIGEGVSWLSLILVLLTVFAVALRYIFHSGTVAFQEAEYHLYAMNFLIAGGWTMLKGGHVRIDILYLEASDRTKALINLLGAILLCMPFCIIVLWASWPFFLSSLSFREVSSDPGGLPALYAFKAVILIGFALITLQAISEAIKSFLYLLNSNKKGDSLL